MSISTNWSYLVILLKYLSVLIYHKICVFYAGLYINVNLRGTGLSVSLKRLIMHDNSKFSKFELWPYTLFYFGDKENSGFKEAWLHHFTVNDHHWEHYVAGYQPGIINLETCIQTAREMPEQAMLEMAADWIAATLAYEKNWPQPGNWRWAQNSEKHLGINPISKVFFFSVICALGYQKDLLKIFNMDEEISSFDKNHILYPKLIKLQVNRDNFERNRVAMKWIVLLSFIIFYCVLKTVKYLLYF
jgi:hypothetical protein